MIFLFFITPFRYFIKLFYSLHYTSFSFLKGCRLEKGLIVPVLCSHSKEKKKKVRGIIFFLFLYGCHSFNLFYVGSELAVTWSQTELHCYFSK